MRPSAAQTNAAIPTTTPVNQFAATAPLTNGCGAERLLAALEVTILKHQAPQLKLQQEKARHDPPEFPEPLLSPEKGATSKPKLPQNPTSNRQQRRRVQFLSHPEAARPTRPSRMALSSPARPQDRSEPTVSANERHVLPTSQRQPVQNPAVSQSSRPRGNTAPRSLVPISITTPDNRNRVATSVNGGMSCKRKFECPGR